ncbi:hypothetical protein FACS1894127_6990 [Clostridia bacterium]|nr:hypothetical protein FACS1894127_6990 [Clostridia bacterium]
MLYKSTTNVGLITLDNAVLGGIVRKEVAAMDGRILLSNAKGKLIKASQIRDDDNFLDFSWNDDVVDLRVYVIFKLGGSITATAENLIENLYAKVAELLEIKVGSISVVVKGILSKNLSKRDIEVVR